MAEGARFTLAITATPGVAGGGGPAPTGDLDVLGLWQRAPAQAAPAAEEMPLASTGLEDGEPGEPPVVWRVELPSSSREAAAAIRESNRRLWNAYAALPDVQRRMAGVIAAARDGQAPAAFQAGPLAAPTPGSPAPFEMPLEAAPDAESAASGQPVIPPLTPEDELLLLLGQISNESAVSRSVRPRPLANDAPDRDLSQLPLGSDSPGEAASSVEAPLGSGIPSTFGRVVDWLTRRRPSTPPEEPEGFEEDVDREDDGEGPEDLRREEDDWSESDRGDISERPDILRRLRERRQAPEDHWPRIDTEPQPGTQDLEPQVDVRPADVRLAGDASSFFDGLRMALGRLSLIQTNMGGRAVGWTYVSWDGRLTSFYRPGVRPREAAFHRQAVQQALFTREAWLRIGLAIAGGLASLGAILAGNPLSILAIYRFVRQIIAQAQRL